jgi:hypothetical protein
MSLMMSARRYTLRDGASALPLVLPVDAFLTCCLRASFLFVASATMF